MGGGCALYKLKQIASFLGCPNARQQQLVPPVNIPTPTKLGSKNGSCLFHQAKAMRTRKLLSGPGSSRMGFREADASVYTTRHGFRLEDGPSPKCWCIFGFKQKQHVKHAMRNNAKSALHSFLCLLRLPNWMASARQGA